MTIGFRMILRGALHLEARYNYEKRETGLAFVGWNLSFGEELKLGLTPMLGGVFGRTNGIAPALTLTLEWGPLALWSQSEYVFDPGDSSGSFFYVWSELSVTGPDRLRVGVVLQRTRVFLTTTEVQGGPLVGISIWKLSATAYLFAPGQDDQFVAVAIAGNFQDADPSPRVTAPAAPAAPSRPGRGRGRRPRTRAASR